MSIEPTISDRLRAAADASAEKWADLTELNDGAPGFAEASRRASDLERLMREAADEIDRLQAEADR